MWPEIPMRRIATWLRSPSVVLRSRFPFRHLYSSKPTEAATEEASVVGPGGPSDRILGMYEQSAGLERLEYLSNLAQRPLFLMDPLKIDRFGTLKAPHMVQSISGQRIVGCTGYPVDSHELMWFEADVNKGPGRCPECGQAFAIEMVNQHPIAQRHHH